MKLISLNTWGGKYFESLIDFIKQHSEDTDIFCLQEIYHTTSDVKQYKNLIRANLLEELKAVLKDFQVFYFPILFGFDDEANKVDFDLAYGQATFVKRNIKIRSHKDYFIYKPKSLHNLKKDFSNLATPLQQITLTFENKTFSIFNFHGTAYPPAKKDTTKRLNEVRKVRKIIDKATGAKILVGDFNLSKNTESIGIFEKDMINLIKKFEIERTRSRLSPFYGKSDFQKFADYTFVTSDIGIKSFQVLDIKISDHLPMILEFL